MRHKLFFIASIICIMSVALIQAETFNYPPPINYTSGGTILLKSCASLSWPNTTYLLTQDLIDLSVQNFSNIRRGDLNCFNITTGNIIFDGQGHKLVSKDGGFAINTNHLSQREQNITIRNINISGFKWGIIFTSSVENSIIENTDISSKEDGYPTGPVYNNLFPSCNRAIWLHGRNNIIRNNRLTSDRNGKGIYLEMNTNANNTITGNTISGLGVIRNVTGSYFTRQMGIFVYQSDKNTIINNTIKLNDEGIEVVFAQNNRIIENKITNNTRNGIIFEHIWGKNSLTKNIISFNRISGIYLSLDPGSIWAQGTGLQIKNNLLKNNNYGLILNNSNDNTITYNIFDSNKAYGIACYPSSSGNIISSNSFYQVPGTEIYSNKCKNKVFNNFIYGPIFETS